MIKPHIRSSLSARLSLWIVTIATILFVAVLWIMLWFAHRALEEETTQKALATLDSASLTIDNELSNIETAVRNMRWVIEQHIDYPDAMILGHCELPGVHKDCPSFIPSKEYQCL